jgi:primosomal protein N' (replication factor Y)
MAGKYVNIAFNLPIDSLFTYSIPAGIEGSVNIGTRVLAPFGKRDITGVVIEFTEIRKVKYIKPIAKVLDIEPVINSEMIEFCKWISRYYFCPIGGVIFSAIPRSIFVESKMVYSLKGEAITEPRNLTELQKKIITALEQKPLTLKQLEHKLKATGLRSAASTLVKNGMLKQEYITITERIKPKYQKIVKFELLEDFLGYLSPMLDNYFKENKIRSEKQVDILKYLIENKMNEIPFNELLKKTNSSSSTIISLAKKQYIKIEEREVSRHIEDEFAEDVKILELTAEQKSVLNEISGSINKHEFKPYLLFGVTGSGKTQVYLEAIKEVLAQNRTAIVLVPEIALTPQLIHRFKKYFGDIIGVIHSRLSEGQRFDVFRKILSNEIKIVIGARSALFAPLENIGIIIVDEEHDHSYKQTEKNPKYNARDAAIVRARLNNAVVVLGSATPSIESFYNARTGKYYLLELKQRAMLTKQPRVEIVDMFEELKSRSKYVKFESPEKRFLSGKLITAINETLSKKQNVMLLQNRRGYSAYLECQNCGNVNKCTNCDITLIYHKIKNHLRCHYCGYTEHVPEKCSVCGRTNLTLKGTGTEKVEEEIAKVFAGTRIKRMDSDTVSRKDAHRKILKSFHEGEYDILIGTQMISKGLDFPRVFLVGVISADVGLYNPDFRSHERTFQLLMQVAGRSGRSSDFGKVIIQTMHPDNYIFPLVVTHDFVSFYEKELESRKTFNYPPFSRMTLIEVKGMDKKKTETLASKMFLNLNKNNFSESIEIMKPAPALIPRLKNKFRYHIIIKSLKSDDESNSKTRHLLEQMESFVINNKLISHGNMHIEVDPLSFY